MARKNKRKKSGRGSRREEPRQTSRAGSKPAPPPAPTASHQADQARGFNGRLNALFREAKNAWIVILLSFLMGRLLIVVGSALGSDVEFLQALGLQPGDFLTVLFGSDKGLLDSLCQWDCFWYSMIWSEGYDVAPREEPMRRGQGPWGFFPMFSITVRVLDYVLPLSPLGIAYLLNNACLLATAWLLYLITKEYHGHRAGVIAASLLLVSPFSLLVSIPYTEALFNLFSITAFYAAYKNRWLVCGLAMACLTATRPTGLFVVIPVLVIAIHQVGFMQLLRIHEHSRVVLAFALCPLGIGLFALYLYFLHGDALAFSSVQTVAWHHDPQIPIIRILTGFFVSEGGWPRQLTFYHATVATLGLCMAGALVYLKRIPEAVFLAVVVLVSTIYTLYAIPRYVFTIWPTYLLLGILLRNRPTVAVAVFVVLGLLVVPYTMGWVNSSVWVV